MNLNKVNIYLKKIGLFIFNLIIINHQNEAKLFLI